MDVATGTKRRVTEKEGSEQVAYDGVEFSSDGKGPYTVTDRANEFQRLTYIDLKTNK